MRMGAPSCVVVVGMSGGSGAGRPVVSAPARTPPDPSGAEWGHGPRRRHLTQSGAAHSGAPAAAAARARRPRPGAWRRWPSCARPAALRRVEVVGDSMAPDPPRRGPPVVVRPGPVGRRPGRPRDRRGRARPPRPTRTSWSSGWPGWTAPRAPSRCVGDAPDASTDSRTFGPVPLGRRGRAGSSTGTPRPAGRALCPGPGSTIGPDAQHPGRPRAASSTPTTSTTWAG